MPPRLRPSQDPRRCPASFPDSYCPFQTRSRPDPTRLTDPAVYSIQKNNARSNRFLRRPSLQPNPRRPQTRQPPRRRRPAPPTIPQTAPRDFRGPPIRTPLQSPRRLRQGEARHRGRDRADHRRQGHGRSLHPRRRIGFLRRPGRMGRAQGSVNDKLSPTKGSRGQSR